MKTRRFDFNFKPLQVSCNFSVDGSVPERQNYDAYTGEYTPDYTITPLVIQPNIGRIDKDEYLESGSINHELANVRWYEAIGTEAKPFADASGAIVYGTLIDQTNPNYEITSTGEQAGRIKIKKNAAPNVPINLRFYAEYADTRTGQLYTIQGVFPISCKNSTKFAPRLELDADEVTVYDPLIDTDMQTVHARLRLGADECPTEKRAFIWEARRADGTFTVVGSDNMDFELSVSSDGTSCTVNRALMGNDLALRCRAKYSESGALSLVPHDSDPMETVTFVRRVHKFDYDIHGLPNNIPAGTLAIAPEVKIFDTLGEMTDPNGCLLPIWYVATNKASGSLSYSQVAHGYNPTIPTAKMSQAYGGVYGVEVKDVGPDAPWEDADGAVFEDADGNVILIK